MPHKIDKTSTNLKLVFLCRLYRPHIGGVEKHVEELSKRLRARGYDVTIIAEQHSFVLPFHERIGGVEIYRIPIPALRSKFGVWVWTLRHIVLFLKADLVHAHDVFWWYLPLRCLLWWKPVYTTFHGYEGVDRPTGKAIRSRKVSERLSKGTICIGDWMRTWYGAHPTAVSYGAASFVQSPAPKNNRAVFLGRLSEDTGILDYMRGVALMKGEISLDIYGEGPLLHDVQTFCSRFTFVQYRGTTLFPEKILKSCRFACVSRYLSMIEAMQCGRYVFAQWNNAIKRDYLLSFPPISHTSMFTLPEEFAQEMRYILDHAKIETREIAAAHDWASGQTWNAVADLYENLWKT